MSGGVRKFKRGGIYWLGFYVNGNEGRESTGLRDEAQAEKARQRREKELHAHEVTGQQFITQRDRKRMMDELLNDVASKLLLEGKGSPQNLSTIAGAKKAFGRYRALSLTSRDVDTFAQTRLDAGYAPASINRVTQMVQQACKLAGLPCPRITRLDESNNVRTGFFEVGEFRAVLAGLPADLQDFVLFGYMTGWRKGEISKLRWQDVEHTTIELRAQNAKNGKARSVALDGELAELIERRRAARQYKNGNVTMVSEFVFHRQGQPIREFRKAWATACCLAGLGKLYCRCGEVVDADGYCGKCDRKWKREYLHYRGRIFHDLRRTAVRDMVRAGTPETVAMSVSGHKTRSMFARYNITDDRDQRKALRATQLYRQQQQETHVVTTMRPN